MMKLSRRVAGLCLRLWRLRHFRKRRSPDHRHDLRWFAAPLKAALPEFEKASGISGDRDPGKFARGGTRYHRGAARPWCCGGCLILSREGLNDLISDNRIAAHSDADLAKTPIGMAVRAGAPKPDISTVEAFKEHVAASQIHHLSQQHHRHRTWPPSCSRNWASQKRWPPKAPMPALPRCEGRCGACHPAGERGSAMCPARISSASSRSRSSTSLSFRRR